MKLLLRSLAFEGLAFMFLALSVRRSESVVFLLRTKEVEDVVFVLSSPIIE